MGYEESRGRTRAVSFTCSFWEFGGMLKYNYTDFCLQLTSKHAPVPDKSNSPLHKQRVGNKPVCAYIVHASPQQDRTQRIVHLYNLGHDWRFVDLSKSSLSAGINALRIKVGEGEFGSATLMIYEGTPIWNGRGRGRKGRQDSVGFHSQPIKAATCTLTRDRVPRYISFC